MKRNFYKSLIMTLLCLTLTSTGTYAWMVTNRTVKARNISPQLEYNGAVIISIDVYKYDQETNQVYKTRSIKDISITPYDSIFVERNVNTPLIFKVTLLGEFEHSRSLDAVVRCNNDTWDPSVPEERHTSNLVYVKAASRNTVETEEGVDLNDDDDESTVTPDFVFSHVVSYFEDKPEQKFLKVHYDDIQKKWIFDSKTKKVSCNFQLTNAEKETDVAEKKKIVVVYLMLDYNADLVQAHELVQYGQIEIMGNTIKFNNDLTTFQFKVNY